MTQLKKTSVRKELRTEQPSIYSFELDEIKQWLTENGEKPFRAAQIFEWLYEKRVSSFDEMTNLSKSLREKLESNFVMTTMKTAVKQTSQDGTMKFLFELHDGYTIETVLMRHEYGNSVCVTTQVGCRIGCTFCASTLGGLKRNLEAGEIVAQVVKVQKALDETDERVSSVVIMGIGEPFDNFNEMLAFLKIINHDKGPTSTFFGFLDLGVGGGPIVLGAIIPMLGNGMLGFRNLYLYSAPAVVIVWIIYYLIHGKHQKSSSKV